MFWHIEHRESPPSVSASRLLLFERFPIRTPAGLMQGPVALCLNEVLWNTPAWIGCNSDRLIQTQLHQFLNLFRHCRREQHRLSLLREITQDLFDLRAQRMSWMRGVCVFHRLHLVDESHLEQLVGLVQYNSMNVI